jgi:uncharacterized protein YecT (DUF1311 family)
VEQGLDETALRQRDLDALQSTCSRDAQTWDFSSYFSDKLAVVREQASFLRAVQDCSTPAAVDSYLGDYPNGVYRDRVLAFRTRCQDDMRARVAAQEEMRARLTAQENAAPSVSRPDVPPPIPPSTLIPRGGQSASFPCDGPLREPVAALICADAELAAADFNLGLTYRTTVRSLDPRTRHEVVRDEIAWLQRRTSKCGIPDSGDWSVEALARFKPCLMAEIQERTRALSFR